MPATSEDEQFRDLFNASYQHLLAYALRRAQCTEDAEEVVAETLLVAWRRRAAIPDGGAIPWLYGVARRVIANQRRASDRRGRLSRLLWRSNPEAISPQDRLHISETTRALIAAFGRLRAADREILRLSAWEGLAPKQLAISLGCSENAAALRLRRARHRLAKQLANEGGFPDPRPAEVNDESHGIRPISP